MSRYILLLLPLLLIGCFFPPPEELDRSIFIADEQYPELPAYTEWGYNTFGAHYNDDVFIYLSSYTVQANSLNDTLTLVFYGRIKGTTPEQNVGISFTLPGNYPLHYSELIDLHAKSFDLTSSAVITTLDANGLKKTVKISSGHLEFKRAQYLLVNSQPDRVILSGYFDFQFTNESNKTFTVKDGRFDVGINDLNFYNY